MATRRAPHPLAAAPSILEPWPMACRCREAAGPVTQHHPAPTQRPSSDAFRMTVGPRSLQWPRYCTRPAPSAPPAPTLADAPGTQRPPSGRCLTQRPPSTPPAPHPAADASPPASPTPLRAHPAPGAQGPGHPPSQPCIPRRRRQGRPPASAPSGAALAP